MEITVRPYNQIIAAPIIRNSHWPSINQKQKQNTKSLKREKKNYWKREFIWDSPLGAKREVSGLRPPLRCTSPAMRQVNPPGFFVEPPKLLSGNFKRWHNHDSHTDMNRSNILFNLLVNEGIKKILQLVQRIHQRTTCVKVVILN